MNRKDVMGIINNFVAQETKRDYEDRELNHSIRVSENGRLLNPISRSHAKRIALNYAARTRSHKFNRVSRGFLNAVEINTVNFIKDRVNRHPSRGQTLL